MQAEAVDSSPGPGDVHEPLKTEIQPEPYWLSCPDLRLNSNREGQAS